MKLKLCGHFILIQFHSGCDAAYRHIGSVVIVSPEPFGRLVLSLLDGFKDVLVQPFVPYRAIAALDVGVLLRLARLDVCEPRFSAHRISKPLMYSGRAMTESGVLVV